MNQYINSDTTQSNEKITITFLLFDRKENKKKQLEKLIFRYKISKKKFFY